LAGVLNLSGGEYTTILPGEPRVVLHDQVFFHEWTLGFFPVYQGARLTYRENVRFIQSDFRSQTIEAEAGWRVPDSARHWVFRAHFTAGSPLHHREARPLYDRYFLGGYETMPGWRLYELQGESAVFGNASVRLPFFSDWKGGRRWIWIGEFSWIAAFHYSAVGDREVFREGGSYRFSTMMGPRLGLGVRGGTAVHLQGEWCHPVHSGRRDIFYVSLGVS